MITVYRAGSFAEEPDPPWRIAARDYAQPSDLNWAEAISAELDCEGNRIALHAGSIREASVLWWTLPDGGHYAEFECLYQPVAAVLVPDQRDWLSFYIAFVLPFLQGHAAVALAHRQQRVGDVLIARARHGEGDHVDPTTGTSEFDTHPRWNPALRDQHQTTGRGRPA
ncbi:hypothetical protein DFH01_25530 [Falsiroseomonas bella]|uniref:Uncharacterized protein n=1 Tax=Falsiroseomonas bella TaxID=2184016 RepID=A0A317F5G0_9PROT|nr:hypothetical protein [Falsiroseomonas bella]PWS34381.1 hypothetical protein DFH01_25530 [Falsiroseomonas bella]